jgi:hypothetical protein
MDLATLQARIAGYEAELQQYIAQTREQVDLRRGRLTGLRELLAEMEKSDETAEPATTTAET